MIDARRLMENKPSTQEHQAAAAAAAALRCPRCDSTNTKFCYYNNYSLSQPRHFCKACKRYWTRGGTLRNVPVGGGCRKNKRLKKPTTTTTPFVFKSSSPRHPPLSHSSLAPPPNPLQSNSSSSNADASMFYSLPALPNTIPVPSCTTTPFDLQPQIGGLRGGIILSNQNDDDDDKRRLCQLLQQLPPLMNDHPLFGSSLLVSSLEQAKKREGNQALLAHEDLHNEFGNLGMIKEVNIEREISTANGIIGGHTESQLPTQNSLIGTFGSEAIKLTPSDSSYLYLNGATVGWPGAGSCWSSATHLI